jgi:hypothetical protein
LDRLKSFAGWYRMRPPWQTENLVEVLVQFRVLG